MSLSPKKGCVYKKKVCTSDNGTADSHDDVVGNDNGRGDGSVVRDGLMVIPRVVTRN